MKKHLLVYFLTLLCSFSSLSQISLNQTITVEMHPNDIRTLVRVVNMLGQEVNPDIEPKGSVLLYLYNDATVEKKLVE